MNVFLYFLPALIVLGSCTTRSDYKAELLQLGRQEKTIRCTLGTLQTRISSAWDEVNALMEAKLPPDMPAEEKSNMLNVRNANLIRMFESFQSLDPAVKQALTAVEQADLAMRDQILTLKKQAQQVESQKMALFEKINRAGGTTALETHRKLYNDLLRETCN
ncbi:MAG: hypothetical protein IPM36_09695 [Lewinellaceae bacterium]|nr:hypothetical protein [Lewinellaceae bacterium]